MLRLFRTRTFQQCISVRRRLLHLHEYQSKELMETFGINTQRFIITDNPLDATTKAATLSTKEYVVKAQVLAGGRGKGQFSSGLKGGVQLTENIEEIGRLVSGMVGHRLVTHQTGPTGVLVHKVMIAEARDLKRETYFAIILDRNAGGPVMVASPEGGMDIEKVAEKSPELIFKESIDIKCGPSKGQLELMANKLGLNDTEEVRKQAMDQMERLYRLFVTVDATQVEINPFGLTPEGEVLCFDAKINFDDNASYRQRELFSKADVTEADPRELEAAQHNLNYIGMDGNIGCLVNGAGLAMATMDILHLHGGRPANFLDVGGSAKPEQIAAAFRLLLSDPTVQSIFVNIFGGIMRCDLIAEGILLAAREGNLRSVPLVIRLAGTNEHVAQKRLLEEYPDEVTVYADLDEAAKQAVRATTSPRGPMANLE